MIRKDSNISIERSGDFEESSFGIDQEDVSLILEIIRNKLYTNKMGSFIREIISNAYDAMAEAKTLKKYPIDITLPAEDNNYTLSIRDYGTGMVEEKVKTIYTKVGKSTRSGSNKFVGMMGIGRLVGFCLNDSFNLTCYVDGLKTEYLCYIDETKCGKVAVLSRSDTTEKNGTVISVNINRDLLHNLEDELNLFLKYIDNVSFNFPGSNRVALAGEDYKNKPEIILQGSDWKIYKSNSYNSSKLYVKMGIVKYLVDINFDSATYHIRNFFVGDASDFVIEVPIGAVDVAASRESLEYTTATKTILISKLKDIHKQATELIKESICKELTLSLAIKKYQECEQLWNRIHGYSHSPEKCILYNNTSTGKQVDVVKLESAGYGTHLYKIKTTTVIQVDPNDCHKTKSIETPVLDTNNNPIILDIEQKTDHSFEIKTFHLRDGKRVKEEGFTFYSKDTTYYRMVDPSDLSSSPDIKRCRTLINGNTRCRILNVTQRSREHFINMIGADILEGAIDFNTIVETKIQKTAKGKVVIPIRQYIFSINPSSTVDEVKVEQSEISDDVEDKTGLWAADFYTSTRFDYNDPEGSADIHDLKVAISSFVSISKQPITLYIVPSNIGRKLHELYTEDSSANDLTPLGVWLKNQIEQHDVFTTSCSIGIHYYSDQRDAKIILGKTHKIQSKKLIPIIDLMKENIKFAIKAHENKSLYSTVSRIYNNGVPVKVKNKILDYTTEYNELVKKYPLLPEIDDFDKLKRFMDHAENYDEYVYAVEQLKG